MRTRSLAALASAVLAVLLVALPAVAADPPPVFTSLFNGAAKQACVTINLRIVDAKTGRVVNATTVEGRSGSVGGGLFFATGSLPVGLGGWAKTPMESAIRNCIEEAVKYIASTKT